MQPEAGRKFLALRSGHSDYSSDSEIRGSLCGIGYLIVKQHERKLAEERIQYTSPILKSQSLCFN